MAKTNFINGDPSQGIMGTVVDAAWLNKVFNHRHDGLNQDGSAPLNSWADTGAANAYNIPLNTAISQRIVGMPIHFMAANANTGASTLNDGFGTVGISKNFDQPLAAGDIKAGQIVTVVWDGVDYQITSAIGNDPFIKLSGDVVQTVHYATGDSASGTGVIPLDDTIPQNTEGNEFLSVAITPKSVSNKLLIEAQIFCIPTVDCHPTIAIFKDTAADALAAKCEHTNCYVILPIKHEMIANTTSQITFKVRAGLDVAGTLYLNGNSISRIYGGVANSFIRVTEFKV